MTPRCFRFPPPDPLTSAMLAETSNLGRRMAGSTQRVAEFVLGKWRLGSVLLKICEQNTETCYTHVHRVYGLVPVCNMSYGTRIAHAWTFVTETRINHVLFFPNVKEHDDEDTMWWQSKESRLSKQIHLGYKLTSLQIIQRSFSPKRGPSGCIICIFKTTVIIITLTYLDC